MQQRIGERTYGRADLVANGLSRAIALADADSAALFLVCDDVARCVAAHPPHVDSPLHSDQPINRFPWDLAPLRPERFLLVEDVTNLRAEMIRSGPSGPRRTVADLGYASAVQLTLESSGKPYGALHLYFRQRIDTWDDIKGRALRELGVTLLDVLRLTSL